MKDYFELGRILKPQGIRGEVKIDAYTDDMDRFTYLDFVFFKRESGMQKMMIEKKRTDRSYAYIKFTGYEDRNQAETLRGEILYIDRENAAKLPEGHHYVEDLIGLLVEDTLGNELGQLTDIIKTGATDVFYVKGSNNLMFPAIPQVVLKKDLVQGKIIIDEKKLQEVCVYDDI